MTLNQIKDGQYVQAVQSKLYYRRVRHQIEQLHPTANIWLSRAILFSESCSILVKEISHLKIPTPPEQTK